MFNFFNKHNKITPLLINKNKIFLSKNITFSYNNIINADGDFIIIGENCILDVGVYLRLWGGKIQIGNNVFIGPYSVLYGHGGLSIGNDVLIASHVTIIPANHNFIDKKKMIRYQGETRKGIIIENNVWIATGVTILDGVKIGKGAIIAAGSVVNEDVPDYSVAVGIPAKVAKKY
jgi:acetyltransferase-like isoleucine patch superfamily enzyme